MMPPADAKTRQALACLLLACGWGVLAGCAGGPAPPANDNVPVGPVCATQGTFGPATVSYADDILPIFEMAGCLTSGCHGGMNDETDYLMLEYSDLFFVGVQARTFGVCTIVPGDPASSYMIEKLMGMPRGGEPMPNDRDPLTEAEIELIQTWILEGAQEN